MAGFYTALIGTSPTIQWPGLSPPCTPQAGFAEGSDYLACQVDCDICMRLSRAFAFNLTRSHDQRVLARPLVSKNGGDLGFMVRIVLEMFASIHYKKLPKVAGTYGEQSRFDGR